MQSPPFPRYLVPPRSKYSPQHPVPKTPSVSFPPAMSTTKFHTHTTQRAKLFPNCKINSLRNTSLSLLAGTLWRSRLRYCATSRKVAGPIPDGVIGIFHWNNPSGHTMALGLTASNRNEYQEYFLGGKVGQCIWLTTLPPSSADCLEIWKPKPPGTLRACPGL